MTRDEWLCASDEVLRRGCDEDFYRASGPGGQKRNKTESAVRLRHRDSGLMVVANESRLRETNRIQALRRLREALAFRVRLSAVDGIPAVLREAAGEELRIRARDPRFLRIAAAFLDQLDHQQARLSVVAESLEVATAKVVRFLSTTDELWEAAQQLRDKYDLPHLK